MEKERGKNFFSETGNFITGHRNLHSVFVKLRKTTNNNKEKYRLTVEPPSNVRRQAVNSQKERRNRNREHIIIHLPSIETTRIIQVCIYLGRDKQEESIYAL